LGAVRTDPGTENPGVSVVSVRKKAALGCSTLNFPKTWYSKFLREISGSPQVLPGLFRIDSGNVRKITKNLKLFKKLKKIAPLISICAMPPSA
jgi:hypothetical protein